MSSHLSDRQQAFSQSLRPLVVLVLTTSSN